MTPRNVDDIINDRLAEMTPEGREAYEAELVETRLALILGDTLRSLHRQQGPARRRLARWLRLRPRRINRIEDRKIDLSLIEFARTAHALGHCVTIHVAPDYSADPGGRRPEHELSGFGFVSSSDHLQQIYTDGTFPAYVVTSREPDEVH